MERLGVWSERLEGSCGKISVATKSVQEII
jgi:hypothetical protein